MALVIGLYNSISIFVSLDASCHLAEEVTRPAITIPRVLYFTTFLQIIVGIMWILAIGFSITDEDAIINTVTKYVSFSTTMIEYQTERKPKCARGRSHQACP